MNVQSGRKMPVQLQPPSGARAIYGAMRAQILRGVYAAGALMPSTRALAAELGCARSTIVAAYDQLISEGFIESRPGARARVASAPQPERTKARSAPPRGATKVSAFGERVRRMARGETRDCGAGMERGRGCD